MPPRVCARPPQSARRWTEIRRRGRVIVGVDQSTNLFSFRDPVSGELQGFDVDIAREVARDLVGDPDKVEFRLLTSSRIASTRCRSRPSTSSSRR